EWLAVEPDPLWRIAAHYDFVENQTFMDCLTAQDSARIRVHYEQIEKLAQNLTPAERGRISDHPESSRIPRAIRGAVDGLHQTSYFDSLRVSTASYVAYRVGLMKKAMGTLTGETADMLDGLGQPSPPVTAKAVG